MFGLSCAAVAGYARLSGVSAAESRVHTKALPRVEELAKPAGAPIELVKDGKLQFVVVTDYPGRFTAYQRLQAWRLFEEGIFRTTGEKPVFMDAVKDRAKWEKAPCIILFGDSAAAREFGFDSDQLKDQELMVSTFSRGIAILGNEKTIVGLPPEGHIDARGRSYGVLFAVADFLERFLDVRYYFPGEYGYYFPKVANLTIDPVAYRAAPHFNTRGNPYAFSDPRTDAEKAARVELLGADLGGVSITTRWRLGGTMELLGKHNPHPYAVAAAFPDRIDKLFYTSPNGRHWYSRENYFANYFDVFNLEKGGFADTFIEVLKKYYASDGKDKSQGMVTLCGQEWINFGVTDVYLDPQDCMDDPVVIREKLLQKEDFERAAKVDGRTLLSNVYGRFYKHLADRIAAELPGKKKLFVLAYYNCKYAPTRYKMPANFDCIVCDGSLLSFVMDPPAREKSKALFKGWYDAMGGRAPGMAYLYGCGDPFGNGLTCEYIGECVKMLGPYLGHIGVFVDSNRDWNRFYSYYIGAHQQWDPELDAVAVFDDMADKMLGKAAAPMKQFHNRLRANCEKYIMPTLFNRDIVYPLAEVDALEKLLAEAAAAVPPDSLEAKRVKVLAGGWDKVFANHRQKLADAKAKMKGVYRVARRTSENVDWSKIPSVPGSNGLKFVWDERGLYGRADGEIHYELTTRAKDAATVKLDYDTMVPGFTLSFTPKFRQKTYCAIEMKPFGRLKLLGEGDDPNFDEMKGPDYLGDTAGDVRTAVLMNGHRYTISNARTAYTNNHGPLPCTDEHFRSYQFGTLARHDSGFYCYSNWFKMEINGFPFGDVDLGIGNMKLYKNGPEKGVEYALNYDGAKLALRFFMKPDSSVFWGELEQLAGSRSVTNAVVRLNSIPSFLFRNPKEAPFPYHRQIRTATRLMDNPPEAKMGCIEYAIEPSDKFFLSQDANYDGTSDDRGMGPCLMLFDLDKVESGKVQVYRDHRDIGLTVNLKMPLKKVRFGIWEERYHRHTNEETYQKFLKEGPKF